MRAAMVLLVHCFAAVLFLGSALSITRSSVWWIRAWDFPRLQIIALGLLTLALLFALRQIQDGGIAGKLSCALVLVTLGLQAFRIAPYTSAWPEQSRRSTGPSDTDGVSILLANVLMDNRRYEPLLDTVRQRQPDLFFAAETDRAWIDALAPLKGEFQTVVAHPMDNTYGLVLFSKLRLIEPRVEFLMDPEVPSIHTTVVLRNGESMDLHLLHPKPPYPAESTTTTHRDAEILIVGRKIGRSDRPTVVAGDLNDVAWSHTTRLFQRISGMLDPRVGRGLFSTFHAQRPWMRWPLDHVFHSDHFLLAELERLEDIGSDHFPIWVRLSRKRRAPTIQEAPEPEPGDLTEMQEKIEEGYAEEPESRNSL